jgi:Arc/MetJ-type ribon-helix-helix transcriptional regulator
MRINISIDDELLKRFDEFCQKERYDRSEYIRVLLREAMKYEDLNIGVRRVYKRDTIEGEKEKKIIDIPGLGTAIDEVSVNTMVSEVKKDDEALREQLKQEKLEKAREALGKMEEMSKAPTFCSKHHGMRVGESYTCGCHI